MRRVALIAVLLLAGCKPPAADRYVARVPMAEREAPAPPIDSPDTTGAIWAPSNTAALRLIYGKAGKAPLFALQCRHTRTGYAVEYTRFVAADPFAKAILALIGNGHVARLKIDAERQGDVWLWRGRVDPRSAALEGLTGSRSVEATVPGAGTVKLNPSSLPEALIRRCRELSPPPATATAPG